MSGTGQIASDREARLGESGHGFAGLSAVSAAHMRSIGADDGGRDCALRPGVIPLFNFHHRIVVWTRRSITRKFPAPSSGRKFFYGCAI
jgi:hypothetical protein